jgi:hypothetical protein
MSHQNSEIVEHPRPQFSIPGDPNCPDLFPFSIITSPFSIIEKPMAVMIAARTNLN